MQIINIQKLVHGGQGLGVFADGKKCFVWGALPGEEVEVLLTKKKRGWAEAITQKVLQPSPHRIDAIEPDMYLSTSPWQIMDYAYELEQKQVILAETFEREDIVVDWLDFYQQKDPYGYRNKMEYSFWFDNDTQKVSLALHRRGSHLKLAVAGSVLATDTLNKAGNELIAYINDNKIEARPLKSVVIRSDTSGNTGISLFVNEKDAASKFSKFKSNSSIFEIIYSNPKSPASVTTEVLANDEGTLTDTLNGREFVYTTRSFFQVNIPVYETVLGIIAKEVQASKAKNILDLYSGVGSIGLSVVGDKQHLTMIETDEESTKQANQNLVGRKNCEVITATVESAQDYIAHKDVVILDPPRAGLHKDVTAALVEHKPKTIIYLSCNPSTQARDVKALIDVGYTIKLAQGFNFFPRTPHIESLIILVK